MGGTLKVRTVACAGTVALSASNSIAAQICSIPGRMTSVLANAAVPNASAEENNQPPLMPDSAEPAVNDFALPDPSFSKRKNHPRKPDKSNRAREAEASRQAAAASTRAAQAQASSIRQAATGRVAQPTASRNAPHTAARTALEERRERAPRPSGRKEWRVSTSLCPFELCSRCYPLDPV